MLSLRPYKCPAMVKNKLTRFAEISTFPNVVQMGFEQSQIGLPLKGNWNSQHFKQNQPIVVELGCGKGEYSVGLSQLHPNKNFIGVDIKGNRIWKGASYALENNLNNVSFLRTRIDFIEACFGPQEVSEIWITFPDPQPQLSREKKRLTHPRFLQRYSKFLAKGGIIHLKTDSHPLWLYTQEVIASEGHHLLLATDNLYQNTNPQLNEARAFQTHYENLFSSKGFSINYLRFTLK